MTAAQVVELLRRECEKVGSQKAWAAKYGISAVYVSDVISAKRAPASRILKALGLKQVISYRRSRLND